MNSRPKRKLSAGEKAQMLALAALVCLAVYWTRPAPAHPMRPRALRVTFLDVGKGDAAVIESPSGKTMVVDTGGLLSGGDDQGRRVIAPFLKRRGIKRIDVLLLTHPHPDHVGGAVSLIDRFPIGLLLDNGVNPNSSLVTRYRKAAQERGICCKEARRGYRIDLGAGVQAVALAPKSVSDRMDPTTQGSVNNTSLVLRLEYGRTAFLLTGDAEKEEEAEMIAAKQPLACDVLKVGHHGARLSTSQAFADAAHPKIAIISVNANNRNGCPHKEVLDRLRAGRARIYRTDRNGAITCLSDGAKVRVETERR